MGLAHVDLGHTRRMESDRYRDMAIQSCINHFVDVHYIYRNHRKGNTTMITSIFVFSVLFIVIGIIGGWKAAALVYFAVFSLGSFIYVALLLECRYIGTIIC